MQISLPRFSMHALTCSRALPPPLDFRAMLLMLICVAAMTNRILILPWCFHDYYFFFSFLHLDLASVAHFVEWRETNFLRALAVETTGPGTAPFIQNHVRVALHSDGRMGILRNGTDSQVGWSKVNGKPLSLDSGFWDILLGEHDAQLMLLRMPALDGSGPSALVGRFGAPSWVLKVYEKLRWCDAVRSGGMWKSKSVHLALASDDCFLKGSFINPASR